MFGLGGKTPSKRELWLDRPDALELLARVRAPEMFKAAARDLIVDGFAIVRSAIAPTLCQQVIDDYHRYAEANAAYVAQNLDETGREKRLVNFHLWSEAEMKVVSDRRIMKLLDFLFGEKTCVYSTLTFKYGTQQPIHRDTPHFVTWPRSRFLGVWTALEDVREDAGPLMYVRRGHRFEMEHERDIFRRVQQNRRDLTYEEQIVHALDLYNGLVIHDSPSAGEVVTAPINRGDVAIWHPQLPHGGAPARDPTRSRWSVVHHAAPEAVQLHMMEQFFTHDGPDPPPRRYDFPRRANGRKVAASGKTAFM